MFAPATFSLFIRAYPPDRGYFISAGLNDVLSYLEDFHFSEDDLAYLESLEMFPQDFLHHLSTLSFTGEVHALSEGRIFLKDEPVLEITAPLIEAQLVETFVINTMNLQVSIATKASRAVHAAGGRRLVDFSLRRTQGTDAGMKVARAGYIAGFDGTSNVLAGKAYGIPTFGTMAHSFVTSFEEEIEAFRAFSRTFPDNTVLLIDTYDDLQGAAKAIEVAKEMAARGEKLRGVRLDSGDMAEISREVRRLLDEEGLPEVQIFASGGFDEHKIATVVEEGGQIDAFGVGTKLGVSADAPYTDMAYKLVEYDGRPVMKLSTGKKTLVGRKQVFRHKSAASFHDTIGLRDDSVEGEPLLKLVMKEGRRDDDAPGAVADIRQRFFDEFKRLGDGYKALKDPVPLEAALSSSLENLQRNVVHRILEKELGES
jgi:nicotinate phosphoribosyltransferase